MSLVNKLKQLKSTEIQSEINWENKKEDFIKSINHLNQKIKGWLLNYITDELMKLSVTNKSITEEHLGSYQVESLEFSIGEYTLVFEPMGRNIIGGKGRVDVYLRGFKSEKYLLILLGKKESNTDDWVLIPFVDKSQRTEFSKSALEKLIENMIDKSEYSME